MAMQKKALVVIFAIAAMLLLASVFALLTSTRTIHSSGKIKSINVEVYTDAACNNVLPAITYADLDPSTSNVTTVYVKNNGNQAMNLSMTTSGWSPSEATGYMSLAWDQENTVLPAGTSVAASLTLTVTNAPQGTTFGFDITITGTEQT